MPRSPSPESVTHSPMTAENRRWLESIGVHRRIAFPFSPKKTIAALHFLVDRLANPNRVEHPLFRLQRTIAILWLADAKHFQVHRRPVTGTRWQAYPQGPVPRDLFALLRGDPVWLAELSETHFAVPFELQGDCITRNLRVPFGYDPKKYLSPSDETVLKAALVKVRDDVKLDKVETSLRGEAFQSTPLYEDIPWELLLPAKMRSKAIVDELIVQARHAAL